MKNRLLLSTALAALLTIAATATARTQEASARKFAILFYESEAGFKNRTNANAKTYWADWMGYIGGIQAKGIVESGAPLLPPSEGTVISPSGTKNVPSKEARLSGMLIVRAGSLKEAVELTKGCPALVSGGKVEVREVVPNAPKMESR